jgi:hypothetical protein
MRRLPHAIAVVLMLMIFSLAVIAIPVVLGILLIGDLGSGFWTVLVTAIAALTAFVFLVWIGIALALAFQVIAMEPRGPVSALRRSFDLVKTTWWPTFGFLIVSAIIATAGAQVLSFALLPLAIASVFAAEVIVVYYSAIVLIQGVVAPAIAAAQAIWYVELRASQESLTAAELVW